MHPKGTCPFGRAHSHAGAWERVERSLYVGCNLLHLLDYNDYFSMKIYIRVYEPYVSPETQEYSSNVYESG